MKDGKHDGFGTKEEVLGALREAAQKKQGVSVQKGGQAAARQRPASGGQPLTMSGLGSGALVLGNPNAPKNKGDGS
jgi:hypothetical protein